MRDILSKKLDEKYLEEARKIVEIVDERQSAAGFQEYEVDDAVGYVASHLYLSKYPLVVELKKDNNDDLYSHIRTRDFNPKERYEDTRNLVFDRSSDSALNGAARKRHIILRAKMLAELIGAEFIDEVK